MFRLWNESRLRTEFFPREDSGRRLRIFRFLRLRLDMEELIQELRNKIVETLNLMDVAPEDIPLDSPLVGGDLGLDSIDVLELVMMLEKDYGVIVDSKELGMRVFSSLRNLAQYVLENRVETAV